MPGESREKSSPRPTFSFSVDIAGVGTDLVFQEVSGLDAETQVIEYRAANSGAFSVITMPGVQKTGNVTLKKGVFRNDATLFDWFQRIKQNSAKRSTITIKLLDESGAATMTWTLANAWPTKFVGIDLNADGNDVAVESLELGHEGLTTEKK
jgi:phage tail-like protein